MKLVLKIFGPVKQWNLWQANRKVGLSTKAPIHTRERSAEPADFGETGRLSNVYRGLPILPTDDAGGEKDWACSCSPRDNPCMHVYGRIMLAEWKFGWQLLKTYGHLYNQISDLGNFSQVTRSRTKSPRRSMLENKTEVGSHPRKVWMD